LAFLNDLWEYNIANNTWTLHAGGGDEPGVYGTQGSASATNLLGGRWGASAKLDASGNLWLFGGFGCDSTGPACSNLLLNDLWRYRRPVDLGEWLQHWESGWFLRHRGHRRCRQCPTRPPSLRRMGRQLWQFLDVWRIYQRDQRLQ
jgi:hypothetical protein